MTSPSDSPLTGAVRVYLRFGAGDLTQSACLRKAGSSCTKVRARSRGEGAHVLADAASGATRWSRRSHRRSHQDHDRGTGKRREKCCEPFHSPHLSLVGSCCRNERLCGGKLAHASSPRLRSCRKFPLFRRPDQVARPSCAWSSSACSRRPGRGATRPGRAAAQPSAAEIRPSGFRETTHPGGASRREA